MYDTPPTRLAATLANIERSQSWLARKLGVAPQSVGPWVRGDEACPRSRQAQIVLFINDECDGALTTGFFFDGKGLAIPER